MNEYIASEQDKKQCRTRKKLLTEHLEVAGL